MRLVKIRGQYIDPEAICGINRITLENNKSSSRVILKAGGYMDFYAMPPEEFVSLMADLAHCPHENITPWVGFSACRKDTCKDCDRFERIYQDNEDEALLCECEWD